MATLAPEYPEPASTRLPTTRRTGAAIPLRASISGGLATATGEENDFKIIAAALMGHSNDNPFQQPVDDVENALFDIDDPAGYALLVRRVESAFRDFEREHRYRLIAGTLQIRRSGDGVVFVFFEYHNIEADERRTLNVPVEGP